jgi:isocitrate dehydrogenase
MFEAIHGSAAALAGKNMANPSGLLQGAVMMLNHIGQTSIAETIQNAWLKTLEAGIHTADIFTKGSSKMLVGTREFAQAVIAHLGQKPTLIKAVSYANNAALKLPPYLRKPAAQKLLEGVDVFVHWNGSDPNELAERMTVVGNERIKLMLITNRGIKVWPDGFKETFCTDHWRCRFMPHDKSAMQHEDIIQLLSIANAANIDTVKTENLYSFDGKSSYSLGQGQ